MWAVGNARSLGLHLDNHIRELIHCQVACLISILPWRTTGAKRVILNYYNLIIFLCDHNDATEALLVKAFQASFTRVFGLLDPLSRPGIRHGFCFQFQMDPYTCPECQHQFFSIHQHQPPTVSFKCFQPGMGYPILSNHHQPQGIYESWLFQQLFCQARRILPEESWQIFCSEAMSLQTLAGARH